MRLFRRLGFWLRNRERQSELQEEIAFHRERLAEDFRRRGMSLRDADVAARRALGNDTFMREEARGVWITPRLDALWKDWSYAWRGLRRSPVFTLVAVVSLSLGIGANTAIFGVIHALLLARLPVVSPEELVQARRDLGPMGASDQFSRTEFDALAGGATPLTMFATMSASIVTDNAETSAMFDAVAGNYFGLLGVHARRGRVLLPDDDRGFANVAVITDRFWRGRMAGDSAVVGRTIQIDRHAFTVVGVLPPAFAGVRFPAMADIFIPYRSAAALTLVRDDDGRAPVLAVFGRRSIDRTPATVADALNRTWSGCCAAGQLVITRGRAAPSSRIDVVDVSRGITHPKMDVRGEYGRVLLVLMAGVGILLLAACANVANLLLARSTARIGELAVRLALGASRARLVTQLVIESLQLSVLGALFGVLLARWCMAVVTRAQIGDLATVLTPALSPTMLAFTAIVCVAAGIVFGVVPAIRVMRTDLNEPLKQSGRRSAGARHGMVDRGIVALQMALALLLVSGAMLLVETLRNLQRVDLGFDAARLVAITVDTRHTPYEQQGMTARMADEILRQVRAIPGVSSAAAASMVPVYGGRGARDDIAIPGRAANDGDQAWFAAVTPGYFASMGMVMRRGRDVGTGPSRGAIRDIVVNERFVAKYFPESAPLGRVFEDTNDRGVTTQNRVAGVVADARFIDVRAPAEPMYFVPVADGAWPFLAFVVRLGPNASAVGAGLARAISSVAPSAAQGDPQALTSSIEFALARERMSATLAMLFGGIALGLAAVGLYGVMLYQVTERTREIGIRMALGARARTVLWLVLRQSLTVVGVGAIAGFPLALLAGRAVSSQLYGITPYNPLALAAAALLLVAVAIVASVIPARRAIDVDPLTALRGN